MVRVVGVGVLPPCTRIRCDVSLTLRKKVTEWGPTFEQACVTRYRVNETGQLCGEKLVDKEKRRSSWRSKVARRARKGMNWPMSIHVPPSVWLG